MYILYPNDICLGVNNKIPFFHVFNMYLLIAYHVQDNLPNTRMQQKNIQLLFIPHVSELT